MTIDACGVAAHPEECLCDVDLAKVPSYEDGYHLPAWSHLRDLDPLTAARVMLRDELDLSVALLEAVDATRSSGTHLVGAEATKTLADIPPIGELIDGKHRMTPLRYETAVVLITEPHLTWRQVAEKVGSTRDAVGTVAVMLGIRKQIHGRNGKLWPTAEEWLWCRQRIHEGRREHVTVEQVMAEASEKFGKEFKANSYFNWCARQRKKKGGLPPLD